MEKLLEKNYLKHYMDLIKEYDMETYHHSINVARLTEMMLSVYPENISESDKESVLIGALLHDVGKIMVPIDIIKKKEPLTKLDFAYIRQHPLNGLILVKEQMFDGITECIILKHHEKLNGSGYPCGFDVEELEDVVRVVMVADIYSALTEHRAYKRGMSTRDSFLILEKLAEKVEIDAACIAVLKTILKIV